MNRRRTVIAQVLLLVILVGGTVYVADSVVQGSLFRDPLRVTVELDEAAGLHPRSDVTYRGTSIGRVADMEITEDGVTAVLALRHDAKVPRDTEAVVANLSAVGEQYLDFRPRSSGGPYLEDGSRIGRKHTSLPIAPAVMIANAFDLASKLDPQDVRTVSRELSTALGDPRLNLLELSLQAEAMFEMLQELQPRVISLATTGQRPLRTMARWDTGMRDFARDLDAVTATMKAADGDLRGLIDQGQVALPELDALLDDTAGPLERLLAASVVPAEIFYHRQPALQAWLNWAPLQMVAMATSTAGGAGGVTLTTNSGPTCQYAVKQKQPTDTRRTEPPEDAQCTMEHEYVQQRGSKNAPRPR